MMFRTIVEENLVSELIEKLGNSRISENFEGLKDGLARDPGLGEWIPQSRSFYYELRLWDSETFLAVEYTFDADQVIIKNLSISCKSYQRAA